MATTPNPGCGPVTNVPNTTEPRCRILEQNAGSWEWKILVSVRRAQCHAERFSSCLHHGNGLGVTVL